MKISIPWHLPSKVGGERMQKVTWKFPVSYIEALKELGAAESKRTGRKVALTTLIVDLSTYDSNFFRTKRSELRKMREHINKEKHRETTTNQEEQATN